MPIALFSPQEMVVISGESPLGNPDCWNISSRDARLVKCDAASLFVFHKILFFCAADVPGKNTGKLLIFIAQHKGQCILIITFISLIRENAAQPRLTIGEYVTAVHFQNFCSIRLASAKSS